MECQYKISPWINVNQQRYINLTLNHSKIIVFHVKHRSPFWSLHRTNIESHLKVSTLTFIHRSKFDSPLHTGQISQSIDIYVYIKFIFGMWKIFTFVDWELFLGNFLSSVRLINKRKTLNLSIHIFWQNTNITLLPKSGSGV